MNKDKELCKLVSDGNLAWRIVDEDNNEIAKICYTSVENMCGNAKDCIESCDTDGFVEHIWEELQDNYYPEIEACVNCSNWDAFCIWFEGLVIEYFITELTNIFNSRLFDCE